MLKRSFTKFAAVAAIALGLAGPAFAAGEAPKPPAQDWQHTGIFGTYDRAALQRGLQVYQNACAACHGMYFTHYRDLAGLGYNEDEIKALAAQVTVTNEKPNDDGEMFERAGLPRDKFPRPFANERMARAMNNGAYPPDLSLIVDARKGGADYIYALLTGYRDDPPEGFELQEGMHYNDYFAGHQIAMAAPLNPGAVEYADGTEASIHQMARDVTQFLAWASEPNMEERKQLGIAVMLFLIFFTAIMYMVKEKLWAEIKNPKPQVAPAE